MFIRSFAYLQPLFTDEDRKILAETNLELQDKVILPSGKVLEDVLFSSGVTKKRHHLMHSFIIDADDLAMKDMFYADRLGVHHEGAEGVCQTKGSRYYRHPKALQKQPDSPGTLYGPPSRAEPFTSGRSSLDLYTMPFSVFTSDARCQIWGVLGTLSFDVERALGLTHRAPKSTASWESGAIRLQVRRIPQNVRDVRIGLDEY
ncbi:hypothetical protein BGZ94_000749 [Podila epigama]|nr:hypothetical protein BGZ94_000749 [Podila epigama]